MKTKEITMVALMTAVLIVLGLIPPIPLGFIPAPIVLQNLGVMLIALILGKKYGTISVAIFLILAALGLPVLPGGRGGMAVLTGPTGGYLLGYLLTPICVSLLIQVVSAKKIWQVWLCLLIVSLVIVTGIGILWMSYSTHLPLKEALIANLIFVPGDIIKTVIAILIFDRLRHTQLKTSILM